MSTNSNEGPAREGYPGGAPQPFDASSSPSGATGFSFQDLLQRWQAVLTRPGIAVFDEQQPAANWRTIWISLAGLGVVNAIFRTIMTLEFRPREASFSAAVGSFVGTFIGFFILAGFLFLVARLFGGEGSFLTYSWLLSLFYVPLTAISSIAGIVPVVGWIVSFPAYVYGIVLAVYATASAQRLSLGRSTAVVLIPVIVIGVLLLIVALLFAAFLIALGLTLPFR